jgi:hypothetical protein
MNRFIGKKKKPITTPKQKRGEQESAQAKALTNATSGETKASTSNPSLHLTSSKTVEGLGSWEGIWRVLVHTQIKRVDAQFVSCGCRVGTMF